MIFPKYNSDLHNDNHSLALISGKYLTITFQMARMWFITKFLKNFQIVKGIKKTFQNTLREITILLEKMVKIKIRNGQFWLLALYNVHVRMSSLFIVTSKSWYGLGFTNKLLPYSKDFFVWQIQRSVQFS